MAQGEMGVEQEPLGYEQATEGRRADAELVREERELRAFQRRFEELAAKARAAGDVAMPEG